MRVGVLGCGNVGAALVAADRATRPTTIAARTGVRLEVAPGRGAQPRPRARRSSCPTGVLTHRRRRGRRRPDVDVVVEVIGGIEPARDADPRRPQAGKPVVTANKELLANARRRAVRGGRRAPASTCSSRRRSPAASRSSGRCASRWSASAIRRVHGHRQRHDQLHPHPDDRGGRRLRRGARRGPGAGLRRARPHGRRRGLRRRRQGGDHRHHRLRRAGSSPATSTTRASRRSPPPTSPSPRRLGYVVKLLAIAERDAPTAAVGVRVHPAMVPGRPTRWPACARASTPCSSRARRSASSCSTAGAPAASPTRQRRARRPHRRRRQPAQGHPRQSSARSPRPRIRPIDDARSRVLPEHRGRRPARRARRGGRRLRRPRRVDPVDGAGGPRRRGPPHLHHPHRPRAPTCRRRCTTCASSTPSSRVGTVLRVVTGD